MRVNWRLGALVGVVLAGCAGGFDLGGLLASVPAAGSPLSDCRAESYDFVGESTLAALGLDDATPVPPPDPDRVAIIWVTHDLLPRDVDEPGGPVETVRMLCFEFADGSGGSLWPVDRAWQPPAAPASAAQDAGRANLLVLLLVALPAVLLIGVSVVAFRRRN